MEYTAAEGSTMLTINDTDVQNFIAPNILQELMVQETSEVVVETTTIEQYEHTSFEALAVPIHSSTPVKSKATVKAPVKSQTYSCQDCSFTTTYRCNLTRHMRKHTGDKFKCELCTGEFYYKAQLSVHIDTMHIVTISVCANIARRISIPIRHSVNT